MQQVTAFLKLIRWPNLLMIALTQYLIRYCIISPYYRAAQSGIEFQLDALHFFLLVLSTILIAGAGYLINDYFDTEADVVNAPNHVPVSRFFNENKLFRLFLWMNSIGVILGIYVGWMVGNFNLGLIHLVITGLLWFYSTNYKYQFLVGNIVVATLISMVVLLVGFYEQQIYTSLIDVYKLPQIAKAIMELILAYAIFAFVITLIREMIKDLQDKEGDQQMGAKTLPIVVGERISKIVIAVLFLAFVGGLGYLEILLIQNSSLALSLYLGLVVLFPLILAFIYLLFAKDKYQYKLLSYGLKGIMVMGILSMIVYRLIFTIE